MIDRVPFETELVPTGDLDLRFRHLHTPARDAVQGMVDSLGRWGQLSPLVAADDGQRLVLVDGFKRQRAAEQIGIASLSVRVVDFQPSRSKALLYQLNPKRDFSMVQEAMLVRELVEVDGLNQVEAATLLDRHKSWVSRRLEMIRSLSPEIADDLQLGLLPPGSGPALARLPQCNQGDFAATILSHRLKPKEIRRLVDIWCKSTVPDIKKYLLLHPHEALEVAGRGRADATGLPHERWSRVLHSICGMATKLGDVLIRGAAKPDTGACAQVEALLERTEAACNGAFETMRKILTDEEER